MRKFCEKSRTRCQYASTPTPRFYRGCFCYDTTLEKTIPCVIMAIVYRSRRTVLCGRLIPCFARRGWTPLLALHKHLWFLIPVDDVTESLYHIFWYFTTAIFLLQISSVLSLSNDTIFSQVFWKGCFRLSADCSNWTPCFHNPVYIHPHFGSLSWLPLFLLNHLW